MEYQVSRNGNLLGSYDHPTLLALLRSGTLRIDDHYWHEGMVEWRQLVDMVGEAEERDRGRGGDWVRRHRGRLLQGAALTAAGVIGAVVTVLLVSRGKSPEPAPVPEPVAVEAAPVMPPVVDAGEATPALVTATNAALGASEGRKTEPAAAPEPRAVLAPNEVYRQVSPSVVMLRCLDKNDRPSALGSGFYVEDGRWIATNRHVIEDSARVEIVLQDGSVVRPLSCRVSGEDQDIAVLEVASPGAPIPWNSKEPAVGDRLYAIGNPKGLQRTLSDGLLSGERKNAGVQFYQMTAPISPGSSGGPIVSDTGELVGMSTYMLRGGQNLNFAVRGADIRTVLRSGSSLPLSAVKSSALSADAKPKLGLDVVKVEDAGSAVGITLRNTNPRAVTRILVRLLYHELPPRALREDDLRLERVEILKVVKTLEEKMSSLELAQQAYATGTTFLTKDPKDWTIGDLRLLPTAKDWTDLGYPGLASLAADLHFYGEQYMADRASTNMYLRRFAQDTERKIMAKLALAYLEVVDECVRVLAELRSERADALLKAKSLLRQNDASTAKAKTEGPKAWAEARQKISHYEDLLVDEEVAAGLVKRVVIAREKNTNWGVEIHVLDYVTDE